ncbi:MAG: Yip1 domain protein [Pelotomaculum sp. PtaB.Bin104]|nr:MAG: Yip1 domain protein [Pelotomaculum sp. PtaB.Bin104]
MTGELEGGMSEQVPAETGVGPLRGKDCIPASEGDVPAVADGPAKTQAQCGYAGGVQPGLGILELVYGLLFDPYKTMVIVARRPPVGIAFLVVTVTGILGLISGYFAASQVFATGFPGTGPEQEAAIFPALLPLGMMLGLFWGYLKWFGFSAVLHLAAGLIGGSGTAAGVFALVGLVNMPSILLIPVNLLIYWLGAGKIMVALLAGLTGLASAVWTTILLVLGLKQVHGLTTGRSLLVVFAPFLTLAVLVLLFIVVLVLVVAVQPAGMYHPEFF